MYEAVAPSSGGGGYGGVMPPPPVPAECLAIQLEVVSITSTKNGNSFQFVRPLLLLKPRWPPQLFLRPRDMWLLVFILFGNFVIACMVFCMLWFACFVSACMVWYRCLFTFVCLNMPQTLSFLDVIFVCRIWWPFSNERACFSRSFVLDGMSLCF